MKKNVTILDQFGNTLGTTYPKRAKGLIKSGRAYLVDGETVQLICPPIQNMKKHQEGIHMSIEIEEQDLQPQEQINDFSKDNLSLTEKTRKETANTTKGKEEKEFSEIDKKESNEKISENAKKLLDAGISLKDILHNLDMIRTDCSYIQQALNNLEKLPYTNPATGVSVDTSIVARAEAVANIVKCKETTNQMMIKLYTQMYTDYMA